MNEISRRSRLDLNTPAELAIRAAVDAVEAAGCDVRLTDAVVLLGQAKDRVADFVDGIKRYPCGCSAQGPANLPDYCPDHGSPGVPPQEEPDDYRVWTEDEKIKINNELLVQPAASPGVPRLGCLDCGLPYSDFPLDTHLSRSQWLEIHTDEGGILCANCIVKRAAKIPGAVLVHLVVEIAPSRSVASLQISETPHESRSPDGDGSAGATAAMERVSPLAGSEPAESHSPAASPGVPRQETVKDLTPNIRNEDL